MLTAGLQKITAAFRLSRENIVGLLFRLKNRILRNLRLNLWHKR